MTEQKILIRGLETNYKIIEDEKTSLPASGQVLILHGWGSSSDSWIKVQEILSKNGFKVICPDFPGFGKSKTPLKIWRLDDYLAWLVEFINFLNLENFSVLAHSFGGRVAIKLAARYPDKIKKLVLCSPAGLRIKPNLKRRMALLIASFGDAVFSLKPLRVFKDAVRNMFYLFLRRADYVKTKGIMREMFKKILKEDLLPLLSRINIETLLAWGKNDKLIPLKYASIFKANIKDSKLEVLTGVGHSPHLEAPGKLSEIIIKFLQ